MNLGIKFDGSTSYATIPAASIIGGLDAWHLELIFSTECMIAKTNWYTMPTLITGWNGSTGSTTGFGLGIDSGKLHIWTRTTTHKVNNADSSDGITTNIVSDGLRHKVVIKFVKAKEYSASLDGTEFYKDTANDAVWGTGDLYIGKCQIESAALLPFNLYSLKFYNDTTDKMIADFDLTQYLLDKKNVGSTIYSQDNIKCVNYVSEPVWKGTTGSIASESTIKLYTSQNSTDDFDSQSIVFTDDNLAQLKKGLNTGYMELHSVWLNEGSVYLKLPSGSGYVDFIQVTFKEGYTGNILATCDFCLNYTDGTTSNRLRANVSSDFVLILKNDTSKCISGFTIFPINKPYVFYNLLCRTMASKSIGLLIAKQQFNFLDKVSVTGFDIAGIEPQNTKRRVAFKVGDTWNKLSVISGAATLTPLTTQDITADSILTEGNTAAELSSVTSCAPMAGKLVYPAVALYAENGATVMPTFGLSANATTDPRKHSISSPEYHISDKTVTINSVTVNKEIAGKASIEIFFSTKDGSTSSWTFFKDISDIRNTKATDIKFIYVFSVEECNEENSARLISIDIKYFTDISMTLTGTFTISPLTLYISEKNRLMHYKFEYTEINDNSINKVRHVFSKKMYIVNSSNSPSSSGSAVDKKLFISPEISAGGGSEY